MPNANTNTGWAGTGTLAAGSAEIQYLAVGVNIVRIWYDGANLIKYSWSGDEGSTWSTPVTVDSTAGNNDVMLNEPIVYDPVTGRLHFLYGRNIDSGTLSPVLCHRYTDNPFNSSPTFSAEHVIDSSAYGANRFYRACIAAHNGTVTVHHTQESNSTFTTDGHIWRIQSTDGGATWGAPATAYSAQTIGPYEPNCCMGSDASVFLTWYDDGANANGGGDLWIAISRDGGATWPTSATKLTTTGGYGRPRPATDAGKVWIIANRPWPAAGATFQDVWSLTSTDNGATFGSPVQRGTHTGSTNLDHPDVVVVNDFVGMIWNDQQANPSERMFIYSSDGGATFSSPVNILAATTGATSDAPRLHATTNRIFAVGWDSAAATPCAIYNTNPFFALLPKVENSGGIDNFPYAAGTLLNTGNWSQTNLGSVPLKADGASGVNRGAGAGTFNRAGSFRNNATYTGNVENWVTVSSDGGGGEVDLFIWDPVAKNGYSLLVSDGDFGNAHNLIRYAAAVGTNLGTSVAALASGEVTALQVIGNAIIGWREISSVWYEVAGVRPNDTTYRSGLKLELNIAGSANAGATLQAFGGGSLVVPASTVAPVASGTVGVGNTISVTNGSWSGAPSRFSYQWQSSPDGVTWTSITNATLPFFVVADATKQYRCQVTGTNSVGASTAANSNTLTGSTTFSKTLSPTQGQTATLARTTSVIKSAGSATSGKVVRTASLFKNLTQPQVATLGIARAVLKSLSSTQSQGVTLVRSDAKGLSATQGQSSSLSRVVSKILSLSQAQVASLATNRPGVSKVLTATQAQAASLVRSAAALRTATQAQTSSFARTVSRTLALSQVQVAKRKIIPLKQWDSTNYTQPTSATLATRGAVSILLTVTATIVMKPVMWFRRALAIAAAGITSLTGTPASTTAETLTPATKTNLTITPDEYA